MNDETFEEYLRVFVEAQGILSDSAIPDATLREFAKNFFGELKNTLPPPTTPPTSPPQPPDSLLISHGQSLWTKAVQFVQNTAKDDRVLYYVRLQSIAALRAHYRRNKIPTTLSDAKISLFEFPSRGLDAADGGIKFTGAPAGVRKVVVTGFDPFSLARGLTNGIDSAKRSNPSGLIAMFFNGQLINVPGQGNVFVRTAIFPVRFQDFNKGIVENAITPSLGAISMLITTSENSGGPDYNYYDVERWASRYRVNIRDNNLKFGVTEPMMPPVIPAGGEYLESTLPYERVITAAESLEGRWEWLHLLLISRIKQLLQLQVLLAKQGGLQHHPLRLHPRLKPEGFDLSRYFKTLQATKR